MERVKVESSQLASVGYDESKQQLEIEFHGGSIYVYDNVESQLHSDLITAKSVGSFFINNIKRQSMKYPYTKIQGPQKKMEIDNEEKN